MQWLDKVKLNIDGLHTLDYYDGCVDTMFAVGQIDGREYDSRKKWIQDQEAKKTKELLERVK